MNSLSPKRRSELRSEAHKLTPLVIIGDKGLTDEVLSEIDRTLKAHELIKVRAATDDREARNAWYAAICERLGAHPVQQIGKVFVLYRERPDEPEARPAPKPALKPGKTDPRRKPGREPREAVKRTSRPRSRTPSPRPASEPRRRPRSTSR
jgi:putative YhbY family RNA-binding protein